MFAGLRSSLSFVLLLAVAVLSLPLLAEGTRTWEQSKFDDLVKGTADGVAIRSSGGLELAPSFKLLYSTPSTYIWSIAADDAGNVYAAAGSPARVYHITPDGKSTIIFEPQEFQVQALKVGPGGVIFAATAPDGKVYRIEHKAGREKRSQLSPATLRRKIPRNLRSIPRGVRPYTSRPPRSISGIWFSTRRAICLSRPEIAARSQSHTQR